MITLTRSGGTSAEEHKNHLLAALDLEGRERFLQEAEAVDLESQTILYEPNARISHIYFPQTAVIAMLTLMSDGASIESATVGREGGSWISASFHSPTMPCQTMVSVSGIAHRVPADLVEEEIKRNGNFHNVLSAYAHALLIQTLRSTACNGLHSIEQRCARWMLTTLDRTNTASFEITHEFLAMLLGVRRSSVSTLTEMLSARGVIESTRGRVRVRDRKELESSACECYRVIRNNFAAYERHTTKRVTLEIHPIALTGD
jgi:CRP-like cAMP-binding protein